MERSSGGVIFKDGKYLVLKYGLGHWGFVKGHIEGNEKPDDAFLREASEEADLDKDKLKIIDGFQEKITYFFKKNGETVYKEVIYLLAESSTFNVSISHEHTKYKWLSYEEALHKITHTNVKNVLKKAYNFLNNS